MRAKDGPPEGFDERAIADFYKSRTITIHVGSAPGGGYAVYAGVLARHLPRHLPGAPTIRIEFMGEKAGFRLTGELANNMPRDGTMIGAIRSANTVESLLNPSDEVNFDVRDFNWIGSVSRQNGTLITWHTSDIRTIADARRRTVVAGAESPFSNVGTLPNILNGLLGTRFVTNSSFDRGGLERAFETGEVESICGLGYNTLLAAHSDWLEGGKINILAHTGLERDPLMPGVPCTIEFAATEDDCNVIRMMDYRQVMGRPYAAPPGVPADRLAALRRAFMATMKDPAFLADARKNNMLVDPLNAGQMADIVAEAHNMPAHIISRTWDLLGGIVD
jgi:tripartite-type tricarboxylate transporter receptor subunit TctC